MNSNKYESYPGKVIHTEKTGEREFNWFVKLSLWMLRKFIFAFVEQTHNERTSKECCRWLVLLCTFPVGGRRDMLVERRRRRRSVCSAIERILHEMDIFATLIDLGQSILINLVIQLFAYFLSGLVRTREACEFAGSWVAENPGNTDLPCNEECSCLWVLGASWK